MSPALAQLLGKIVPQRLKGRVGDWFSSQSPEVRAQASESWDDLAHWILSVYLGEDWRRQEELNYKNMTFRDSSTPSSKKEMPSNFVLRRTFHYRMIKGGVAHSQEEVLDVMSATPKEWFTLVHWHHLTNISLVLAAVRLWDNELVKLWERNKKESRLQATAKAHVASSVKSPKSALAVGINEEEDPQAEGEEIEEFETHGERSAYLSQSPRKDTARSTAQKTGLLRSSKARKQERERSYRWSPWDDKVSNKPPPRPCFACGSLKHWNKDCPHWGTYETLKTTGKLPAAMAHSVERDYDDTQEVYYLELANNESDQGEAQAF